ncbi:putative Flocculation protein FLO11 [Streptomyces aurantiacus JA 4570]|uniref:Putative Flocculation protein FLO11 n=2 Tax=Streptomyces aurantiacus TaxID=47760 RepID=S4AT78_9ACTN|nr:putative Flocculation protein FLO11 [Streptomyces aurantiacus JA 4570]
MTTGLAAAGVLFGTMGALPEAAGADPAPVPVTERVSVDREGAQLAEPSYDPDMGEGRITAFTAEGPLWQQDTNGKPDVHKVQNSGTGPVSGWPDGPSYDGSPCASGRMTGFVSESTDVTTRPLPDRRPVVYVHNTAQGKYSWVRGYQGVLFASAGQPTVDPHCQWLTFTATLPPAGPGEQPRSHVYRFVFNGGTVDRVSDASPGAGDASDPDISAGGRYVAYEQGGEVHVRDMDTGTVEKASVARDGGAADGTSSAPSLSADGRRVAFASRASNLVDGDRNGGVDVFVRDLDTGVTTLVRGPAKKSWTAEPSLSADGTHVAYTAARTTGGTKNRVPSVYLRELTTGKTQLISVDLKGGRNDLAARNPSVNADGGVVAFDSASSDLVSGDTNGVSDVFLRTVKNSQ